MDAKPDHDLVATDHIHLEGPQQRQEWVADAELQKPGGWPFTSGAILSVPLLTDRIMARAKDTKLFKSVVSRDFTQGRENCS